MKNSFSESYAAAGVDVESGYESVSRIKPMVESTYIPGVIGSLGGFGAMFDLSCVKDMEKPVMVSGTDGVGTKLKIAFSMNRHDTVGIDCVAMCVNDIICCGAKPLFFLDYLAMGKNYPERTEKIVEGIADGCRQAGCALIGGETAEMPGFYPDDEYDIAGFACGVADESKMIDGSGIAPGDRLIGIASSGLHSNGFSLARKVLGVSADSLGKFMPELGRTLGEELLAPTRIYVKPVLSVIDGFGARIKGICNITGGGFYENVPRMLPDGVTAHIDTRAFPTPAIFPLIADRGGIDAREMYNVFNMGVGLVLAVSEDVCDRVIARLADMGERACVIGTCGLGEKGVELSW